MMIRLLCVVAAMVAVASPELLQRAGSKLSKNSLHIEEITQILEDSDPTGQDHNIRVTISEYEPLENVVEWKFLMHSPSEEEFVSYSVPGDGHNPTSQTEFIFDGNLVEADSFLLQAKNSSEDIAMEYKVADITDLETAVVWVGESKDMKQSSLRIMASERVENISVDGKMCTYSENPCYILTPDNKPSSIKRCLPITDETQQCDERVTSFVGIEEDLPITLEDDGSLMIEFTYPGELFSVEVVTYDPKNSSNIFSSYPYKCRFPLGKFWKEGDKMKCRHELTLPDDQEEMMVLIVKIAEDDSVTNSALHYFDKSAHKKLSLEKISCIISDDDPTGVNHNIRVEFNHQSLEDIKQWKLMLHENHRDLITYTVDADGSNPSTQTEAVFEGKLEKSDAITLNAWNTDGKLVAADLMTVDIPEPSSKSPVTWVGGAKKESGTSLRVLANDDFPEITVGEKICTKEESPCYYITPSTKPDSAARCIDKYMASGRLVQLCDERVTQIPEINPEPSVSLSEEGKISVELKLTDKGNFQVEVVAYDHEDHTKIFSQSDYRCLVQTSGDSQESDTMTCLHKVSLPEGVKDFMVLVVKTDADGNALESSLVHPDDNHGSDENVGVIIGAVVGVLIGIALIAFLVVFCMKRREPAATSQSTSYKYKAAQQEDKEKGETPAEDP